MNKLLVLSVFLLSAVAQTNFAAKDPKDELRADCTVGVAGTYTEKQILALLMEYSIVNREVEVKKIVLYNLKKGLQRLCFFYKVKDPTLPPKPRKNEMYTDVADARSVFFMLLANG